MHHLPRLAERRVALRAMEGAAAVCAHGPPGSLGSWLKRGTADGGGGRRRRELKTVDCRTLLFRRARYRRA